MTEHSKRPVYLGKTDEQAALDKHFNLLLKNSRQTAQQQHGERVEARQRQNSDYVHGGKYVYDATSQTFDPAVD